jgi:type II secretory pathway pseudopilin PulG
MNNNNFTLISKSGVTLVEILISLAVLVLVTGALSNGTNYLTRRLVRAKNASVARNLAWQRLAEIKSKKIEPSRNSGIFGRDFPDYRYVEEIKPSQINGKSLPGLFEYELFIYWPEAWNEDSIELNTLIADYMQSLPEDSSEPEQSNDL